MEKDEGNNMSFTNKGFDDEGTTEKEKPESVEKPKSVDKSESVDTPESVEKPKPFQPPAVNFFKLFRFAKGFDYCLMIFGVVGSIITGLSAPANIYIFGHLTDSLVKTTSQTQTVEEFLNAVDDFAINNSLIGFALLVASYFSILAFTHAAQKQFYRIRVLYFRSALRQDIGWYDLNNTGDFASRMTEDLSKLEEGMSEKILHVVHGMSAFVGCILMALIKGWELALISLGVLPIIFLCLGLISFLSSKLSKNQLESYAKAATIAEEVLTSIRTVVAFNGQKKETDRYEKHLREAKKNNIRRSFFNGLTFGLLWFLIYGNYGLAFWYGVKFVIEKTVEAYTPGVMTTVFFSVMVGSMNFLIMAPNIEVFAAAKAAAAKVFWVIDRKTLIDPISEEGLKSKEIQGNIEFRNVKFSYPSRPDIPILKGISFEVNKGETVALVGSSGCGKSTCVQLIQRFYDPTEGQVLIDGEDIKNINVKHLRKHIGVVGQEPVLFSTTIGENIRHSRENATQEEIEEAAKMANAHNFISKLPRGYNTMVGERGAQMSGGQKQRVAIARALIRNPAVLLLDEATSALDNASEAKVQAALDKASRGRTTIIVAHRLSTIRQADKIIVLSKGEIMEQGTHNELIKKKGHYYDLVTTQTNVIDLDVEDKVQSEEIETVPNRLSSKFEKDSMTNIVTMEEESNESKKHVPFTEILKMSLPEWKIISVAVLMSVFIGFCSPFFSIVFGDIMGVFGKPPDVALDEAKSYCIYFAIIGAVLGTSTFIQMWVFGWAGEILTMRLRSQSFSAMLKQEMSWFDDRSNSVGALCARLSGDTSNVQGATGQPIGAIVQGIATISLAIAFAMYFQWKLGLTALSLTPFLFGGSYLMAKSYQGDSKKTQKVLEKSSKIAVEAVGNIRTVASLGRELSLYKEYENELEKTNKIFVRGSHIKGVTMGVSRSLMFFCYAICMAYGGRLIAYEKVPYEDVFKVTQTLIMASFSLANVFAFAPNFQKGLASATTIYNFLRREPKIRDEKCIVDDSWEAEGRVIYRNIEFKYPSRPNDQILRNLSLEILKGKKVALVGQSGCGKSTLIQLLQRFYDPDIGEINLDYHEIKTLKLNQLRRQLGVVSQEPVLFDKTIAENIAYGDNDREVPMTEIIDAAEQANIHNFIVNLPLGYETPLGEKGTQLSGGQKQRVAIARALIKKPKVLLLDEATSALDTQSEKVVQAALDKAGFGRTCITIAHRLSTIVDADVIVVISQGRVAEMGTHTELLSRKGLYRQLYTLQGK